MDWIIGLQKAIDYIENNLTDAIDYEKVAAQSYSSSYHFQRVFSILCGFTIGEYIRNRRLSLAGLFMEEMINALMTAQKTPEIFAALHKGDTKLTAHEDFNDFVCENHDKINFLKRWTHSDTQLGAALSLEEVWQPTEMPLKMPLISFLPPKARKKPMRNCETDFLPCCRRMTVRFSSCGKTVKRRRKLQRRSAIRRTAP